MKFLYIAFLLFAISTKGFSQTNVVSDQTEFNALKALWQSTNGSTWTNNTGWPTDETWPASATAAQMSTWFGVTVTNGDITQINLNSNNLTGTLPSALGDLGVLTRLSVFDNKIGGSISPSLGSISSLTQLLLYKNKLTGELPSSLGSLANLTHFYIYENQLTGQIPSSFSALTKMSYFDVHTNQLSGNIPSIFAGMTFLAVCYLNNNRFSGSLPSSIMAPNIDVSNNMLTGAFPTVAANTTSLLAANNGFTSVPSNVSSLTVLLKLDFSNNELPGIPTNIIYNTNKANLQLLFQNNRLDFSILEALTGFKSTSVLVPQKNIRDQLTQPFTIGESLTLTARQHFGATTVVWKRLWPDGSSSSVFIGRTYIKNPTVLADEGIYYWISTSTAFIGVIIQSDPIQVKASERFALDNFAFQYKYDARKRMVQKKVPGADWVYMVYDDRDRLVMTQDGNQRKQSKWTVTKYDILNRPIITAVYTHSGYVDQAGMSALISTTLFTESFNDASVLGYLNSTGYTNTVFPTSNLDILSVTYYDNYVFASSDTTLAYKSHAAAPVYTYNGANTSFPRVKGMVTGTKVKVLEAPAPYYLMSANYYDDYGRVVQTVSHNYDMGTDRVSNNFDFAGKVTRTRTVHSVNNIGWNRRLFMQVEGNTLVRTPDAGTGGTQSNQFIPASTPGWAEATVTSATAPLYFGLADTDPDLSANTIDYAFYINNTSLSVTENGVTKLTTTVAPGDRLRIERAGTQITYYKNGASVYPSTVASTTVLYVDISFPAAGARLLNANLSNGRVYKSSQRDFTYDNAGRLLTVAHQNGSGTPVTLVKNEYNELGQLVDKKLHSTNGTNFRQSLDYRYNIRGWLTSMNGADLVTGTAKNQDGSTDRKDLFGIDLIYNEADANIGNVVAFNGNISAMRSSINFGLGSEKERAYKFEYDTLNRLKKADQKVKTGSWAATNAFQETDITYDFNGNIRALKRTDNLGSVIDQLTYDYGTNQTKSNALLKVSDAGTSAGFSDGTTVDNDYNYDNNGNLITDKNKNVTSITYNLLNLPATVVKGTGESLLYFYDATGKKLSQVVKNAAGAPTKSTDYHGEYIYESDTLRFVNHEEGRAIPDGTWTAAPQLVTDPDMTSTASYYAISGTSVTISNVTLSGQTYLKVVSNQATSTPGFMTGFIDVAPGKKYTLRIKGYTSNAAPVSLYILGNGYQSGTLSSPRPDMKMTPSNEDWIETTFTVPVQMNKVRVGAQWRSGVQVNYEFFVNRMELYEYNDTHGNSVFTQTGYVYEYHLKDHLGNVRMTFTTKDEKVESFADMESDYADFLYYTESERVYSNLLNHHVPAQAGYAARLTGYPNERYGLAKSLSVMPGDTVDMEVYAKYLDLDTAWTTPLSNLVTSIGNGSAAAAGVFKDGGVVGSTTGGLMFPFWALFEAPPENTNGAPKAYMNWLVFDRDYNLKGSGARQLTTAAAEHGENGAHQYLSKQLLITEPGYVYVYLSNDHYAMTGTAIEVYFDDFNVEHVKSPVISSQDYYPFGLTFNNYLREASQANQYQYNGKEEQDELSLDWLDYGARMYMTDIGRWNRIDRLTGHYWSLSPYHYAGNSPVNFFDVNGDYFTGLINYVEGVKDNAREGIATANKNIASTMKNISNALISGDMDGAKQMASDVNRMAEARDEFQSTLDEVTALENSTQEYYVSDRLSSGGATTWQQDMKRVNISFAYGSDNSLIAHELKHAYQFETGTASFGAGEGGRARGNLLFDLTDEFEAYKRQAVFNRSLLPSELEKGITGENIRQIESSDGAKPYSLVPSTQQVTLPSLSDPATRDGAYKKISNTFQQAFRANGKTYYPGVQ